MKTLKQFLKEETVTEELNSVLVSGDKVQFTRNGKKVVGTVIAFDGRASKNHFLVKVAGEKEPVEVSENDIEELKESTVTEDAYDIQTKYFIIFKSDKDRASAWSYIKPQLDSRGRYKKNPNINFMAFTETISIKIKKETGADLKILIDIFSYIKNNLKIKDTRLVDSDNKPVT